jgi:hypothetical protein
MMAMNRWDRLRQAWQSQSIGTIRTNPDRVLKVARFERRAYLGFDIFLIAVSLSLGVLNLRWAFQDIQKDWPWLIYSGSGAWVAGYALFNRWRLRGLRRYAANYKEPLLAHVEWSIKDIEHRMRVDANSFWWYLLPIALGCMIPPVILVAMEYSKKPQIETLFESLFALLLIEGMFVGIFFFIHWFMKRLGRMGLEGQRQELQALRALRESLLKTEV